MSEKIAIKISPWSIEFNKDVLVDIHGDVVEVLADEDLDGLLVPVLGDLLAHKVLLQLSLLEVGDKLLDILGSDAVILGLELCHLLAKSDGSKGGQLTVNNSEELQDPLVVFFVSVDSDKQHLALILLGLLPHDGQLVLVVISLGGGEQEEVGLDLAREDLLGSLVIEVHNKGQRLGRHELSNLLLSDPLGQDSLAVVKGLDNNDSLSLNSVLGAVTGDSERHVVNVGGSGEESLGSISGLVLEASEDSHSFPLNKGLDSLGISQGSGRRSSLLLNPADNGLGSSATSVLHGLAVLEELEGGVSTDFELLSQLGLLSGVDLAELHSRVLLSQETSGLSVLRGKGFAMAAPRGIELNQDKFVVSDSSFEVVVSEYEDPLLFGDLGLCHGP